ncbi:MAG: cupin domain-containing protein [Anaerolineae bacterium]
MVPLKHLWFLNTYVTIRVSEADSLDGISILEHRAPHKDSPPLHIHRNEDEIFHILEGEFRFVVNGQEKRQQAGDILLIPRGTPHSYYVESEQGGHWLTTTIHADFERFVRVMARPAERHELPAPAGAPSPEAIEALNRTAAEYGIDIVGPPIH